MDQSERNTSLNRAISQRQTKALASVSNFVVVFGYSHHKHTKQLVRKFSHGHCLSHNSFLGYCLSHNLFLATALFSYLMLWEPTEALLERHFGLTAAISTFLSTKSHLESLLQKAESQEKPQLNTGYPQQFLSCSLDNTVVPNQVTRLLPNI